MLTRMAILLLVVGLAPLADAQINRGGVNRGGIYSGNRGGVTFRYPVAGWWGMNAAAGYYGGYGNMGSTPAESYARGQAEMIRAQGEAYKNAAAGAIDYEQARAVYLENQQKWQQIQFERKQMGEQKRAEEQAAQRAARERRQASNPTPPPAEISDLQYEPSTGNVTWPELLQGDQFTNGRKTLEELFKVKAHTGGTSDVNEQIFDAASALRTQLKSQVRQVSPNDYIEARKFLDQVIDDVGSA